MRVLLALGLLACFGLSSCRCGDAGPGAAPGPGDDGGVEAGAAAEEQEIADDDDDVDAEAFAAEEAGLLEASTRFRDAGPGVEVDSPIDPACRGGELSFAAVVVDERCAVDLRRSKKLRARLERDGGAPRGLHQEASAAAGGRITLRLVNGGTTAVTLPLSFHNKLPAFSVLAEDDRHTIYELEPPLLDLRDPGQGNRTRLARMELAPGGIATATVAIVPTITKVLARGAGDPCKGADAGGACASNVLVRGRYVLHIGELITDVEAGDPARVAWTLASP